MNSSRSGESPTERQPVGQQPVLQRPAAPVGPARAALKLQPMSWSAAAPRPAEMPPLTLPRLPPMTWSAAAPRPAEMPPLTLPRLRPMTWSAEASTSQVQAPVRPRTQALPSITQVRHLGPKVPTIPAQIITSAVRFTPQYVVSHANLTEAALRSEGAAAYGLLGTLRLLNADLARTAHARYALDSVLGDLDATLPAGWDCGTSKGHQQQVLDAFGTHAMQIADCTSFDEVLTYIPEARPTAAGLKMLTRDALKPRAPDATDGVVAAQLLLSFKQAVAERLNTVLAHERTLLAALRAPSKCLETLSRGVQQLLTTVDEARKDLRFAWVRKSMLDAPSLAPKRPPLSPIVWPDKVAAGAPATGDLQTLLAKVQSEAGITIAERTAFLQQVYSCQHSTPQLAAIKAGYFRTLGLKCASLQTQPALQESVRWFDQALCILREGAQDGSVAEHQTMRRLCYEARGKSFLLMAQRMTSIAGPEHGKRFCRAHRDAAQRDFAAARALQTDGQAPSPDNYVDAKERTKAMDAAQARDALQAICAMDDDFADAHLLQFWRCIEASELDTPQMWDVRAHAFCAGSAAQNAAKRQAVEHAIAAYTAAELTALYQHHLAAAQPLAQRDAARLKMGYHAWERLTRLRLVASKLYSRAGDAASVSSALLHLSHAVVQTGWMVHARTSDLEMAQNPQDKARARRRITKLRRREVNFRHQKAALYGRLKLWHSQALELEAGLQLARAQGFAAHMPRLHLALGKAYLKQSKTAQASAHLRDASRCQTAKPAVKRQSLSLLEKIAGGALDASGGPTEQSEVRAWLAFQPTHIITECLQILEANERACNSTHGVVWNTFVTSLAAATSLKAWCDVVLTHIELTPALGPDRVARLVALSNLQIGADDPTVLEGLQESVSAALAHFEELKQQEKDAWIGARDAAQAKLRKVDAFYATTQALADVLKQGARIRPDSPSRQDVEALAQSLSAPLEADTDAVCAQLGALLGQRDVDAEAYIKADTVAAFAELAHHVNAALTTAVHLSFERRAVRPGAQEHAGVVTLTGQTVFLSLCTDLLSEALAKDPSIREVRIVAEHLYMDTSLTLRATNLVLGAQRVEWLPSLRNGGIQAPIEIDLSGRDGVSTPAHFERPKARSGARSYAHDRRGDSGDNGKPGADAAGGEPGGDLVIHCTEACVGLTPGNVRAIKLGGGAGGAGGNGQDGGDGAAGADGHSRANVEWRPGKDVLKELGLGKFFTGGYLHEFRGGAGGHAGEAGIGGALGLGGEGGASGRLHLQGMAPESAPESARKDIVQQGDGPCGPDGSPGHGGKGALGGADGLDCLLMKRDFFHGHKRKLGYGLRLVGEDKRKEESWADTYKTADDTKRIRQTHDRAQACQVRQAHTRQRCTKVQTDVQGLANHLDQHLAHNASAQTRSAFEQLSGARAAAQEAASLFATSGEELEATLAEIGTLRASTAAVMAQAERRATAAHERIVTASSSTTIPAARHIRIQYDGMAPRQSDEVLLELGNSPVPHPIGQALKVHSLEVAIDAVNRTFGADAVALGVLLQGLGDYLVEHSVADKERQALALVAQLTELINTAPLAPWVQDFTHVHEGMCRLEEAATHCFPALNHSIKSLALAVACKGTQVHKAQALCDEARGSIRRKINEGYRDLRILSALRRAFVTDRLLRTVVAAAAGLRFEDYQEDKQPVWLRTRLNQKILQLLAPNELDNVVRAHYAQLLDNVIDALCVSVRRDAPTDPKKLTASLKAFAQSFGAQIERDKTQLAERERCIEARLQNACADLAAQDESLPDGFAFWSLADVANYLQAEGDYTSAAVTLARRGKAAVARPVLSADDVHGLCTQLACELATPELGTRLKMHIELQLESLRAHIGGPSVMREIPDNKMQLVLVKEMLLQFQAKLVVGTATMLTLATSDVHYVLFSVSLIQPGLTRPC
ncbi:hypothetical protein Q3G72_011079 [Acer saccharum]|nr:hypothetical protein Q3G72_011079 [Acer saccharum]